MEWDGKGDFHILPVSDKNTRLRLHATQSQFCYPTASNALAIPTGKSLFTATPTERTAHCTLQKSRVQAVVPLTLHTRRRDDLCRDITFSCCQQPVPVVWV
ncbi:hypothetical protein CLOSTMETH_01895 [[Clostridium] methylpentosum DSM 5476]|uniref:Uncharacterized protein n=1 Tax=[Clostridium] methylpentosum DSM 5476 TaxID=537013 RepID=C0EDG8_9FIRM|nr:hypothetical protein CLOSTMETH_01895 [[Clostridium] methylpentosum DSM 5476]